ncbi:MAG: hypothetical protein DHS20C21_15110 [Gemmatimonadota bacterium]|nr:MAG: hypothetical protein DHS20C21_15110 [Gemmatimonadota bacterium]
MSHADAVRFFQALGDETRLALLQELRREERTVGDLVDALRCPQPKVSRHLKVLKEAGLVTDRRDGRNVAYSLTTPRTWPAPARDWLRLLDAGLLSEELIRAPKPPRPRRTATPAHAAEAASGTSATAKPASRGAAPTGAKPVPPAPRPSGKPAVRRRTDLETHLL